MSDKLLSLRAVALRLSLFKRDGVTPNPRAVRYLHDEGRLTIIKIGPKSSRVSESSLQIFIEASKNNDTK